MASASVIFVVTAVIGGQSAAASDTTNHVHAPMLTTTMPLLSGFKQPDDVCEHLHRGRRANSQIIFVARGAAALIALIWAVWVRK